MEFLPGYLPGHLSTLLTNPTIQNLTSTPLTTQLSSLHSNYLQPYIIYPLSTILVSTSQSYSSYYSSSSSSTSDNEQQKPIMPDLLSILLLAVILLISLKILDYARRVIIFWVSLVLKLVFWGALVGTAWYVYRNGLGRALEDFGWLWGVMEGFWGDLPGRDYYRKEFEGLAGGSGSGSGVGKGRVYG